MSFFECDKCGGIPGVTHCCTDNRRAQPAQAGQVLTDEAINKLAAENLEAFAQFAGAGEVWYEGETNFARAIESAVLAKTAQAGQVLPRALTLEQCVTLAKLAGIRLSPAQFSGVLEAEVSEFDLQTFANLCIGIVGKEGV